MAVAVGAGGVVLEVMPRAYERLPTGLGPPVRAFSHRADAPASHVARSTVATGRHGRHGRPWRASTRWRADGGEDRWTPVMGNGDAHRGPRVVGWPQTVVHAEDLSRRARPEGASPDPPGSMAAMTNPLRLDPR